MNKKNIQELYLKKIQQIKRYNKSYYEESHPIIPDNEYDNLKKEILSLENK